MMTLMKAYIERLQELPKDGPDTYAATYLTELEEEQRWDKLFDQTTDEQWTTLVEEARKEVKEETTVPLDQVLHDQES